MFQSTPSGGKATGQWVAPFMSMAVSIHAFRGEGDFAVLDHRISNIVSIHAFRGEGDAVLEAMDRHGFVSIHAFRGEGDAEFTIFAAHCAGFNPRLPGGRRPVFDRVILRFAVVSIHAFRGEGDLGCLRMQTTTAVSIHAFRGEGDLAVPVLCCG